MSRLFSSSMVRLTVCLTVGLSWPGMVRAQSWLGKFEALAAAHEELGVPTLFDSIASASFYRDGRRVCIIRIPRPPAPRAVARGLQWLAAHQDANGRWDADGFSKHDRSSDPRPSDRGSPLHDVGISALATLAFLADGHSMRRGSYQTVVRRAVAWLARHQARDGRFGTGASQAAIYDHVLATYTLVEAAGRSGFHVLRRRALLGLQYLIERHRLPDGGFGYSPMDAASNMSITGWCVLALKSARDFGLPIDADTLPRAMARIAQLTDESGQASYGTRRFAATHVGPDNSPRYPVGAEARAAISLGSRYVAMSEAKPSPAMTRTADLLMRRPRARKPATGVDHVYWFFGTLALYCHGSPHFDRWCKHVSKAIVATQRNSGSMAGSWDPNGTWGAIGGRVYSTAMMTMTLTMHYRYSRLVR